VKNETALLTTFNEVDMARVLALRQKYQDAFVKKYGYKIGLMAFFIKAVSNAARLYPVVNSRVEDDEIVTPDYTDVSVAVQSPKGLMVPVIRDVQSLSLAQIEAQLKVLADKAKAGKISLEEMTGGTITVTNGGTFGSMLSTPLINPPQSAILGMHNIVERPVAVQGKVEIRPVMYVALSYDHRIVDGKDSVGFLVAVKKMIEDPLGLFTGGKNPDELLLGL
jgi:2-oxoglutarate dehydrogenase E2 component (dihydrolipoamide succinyltransferase)